MNLILPLLVSGVLFAQFSIAGGFAVGNGGDAVLCQPSAENHFNGTYSLDYLMTLNGFFSDTAVPVNSIAESTERIKKLIAAKYPALLPSFTQFMESRKNTADWTKKRIWLVAPHGLLNIEDEQISRTLPDNCKSTVSGKEQLSIMQAIVRVQQDQMIKYEFDPKVLAELAKKPLQYSHLLIHEWLWNHFDNPQKIRWANQFLHSTVAAEISASDFKKSLNNIGLSSGFNGFWSVCDRTPEIRRLLESYTKKSCANITLTDLDVVEEIRLHFPLVKELHVNDLNSLSRLFNFELIDSELVSIPEEFFKQNSNLTHVRLEGSNIGIIQGHFFSQQNPIFQLSFKSQSYKLFAPDFWENIPYGISDLAFLETSLTELPENFFKNATERGVRRMSFSGNKRLDKKSVIDQAITQGFNLNFLVILD